MADVFTLYFPDGRSEVVDGTVPRIGTVWTRGEYRHPTYPSVLNARVGEAGIKVWMVIEWWEFAGRDEQRLLEQYGTILTREDVLAALWYYEQNTYTKSEIDRRIREEQMA